MIKTLARIGVVSLLAVGALAPAAHSVAASGGSQDGRTWAAPKHLAKKAPKHL